MRSSTFDGTPPDRFITDFFNAFRDTIVAVEDDGLPAAFDRFHTPDIVQTVDGNRLERDALLTRVREARGHAAAIRIDVRDALADGDLLAARYLLYAGPAADNGRDDAPAAPPVAEGYFFGQFTADGRMRRADMVTRQETEQTADSAAEPVDA